MAQTFDIRFDRERGLAALFEAPTNRFRWKGSGLLRIDAAGVDISVRRHLSSLLAARPARHIPAGDLREVYREGESLRVEFATPENAREVLPFWVQDAGTAATIVKLLPTDRTVEMEHSTARAERRRFRLDWRVVAALVLVGLALAVGTKTDAPAPLTLPPAIELPTVDDASAETPLDAGAAEPALQSIPTELAAPPSLSGKGTLGDPDRLAQDLPPGSPAFARARDRELRFAALSAAVETNYRIHHRRFIERSITTDEFLEQLDDCEMRWWDFTYRTLDDDALADSSQMEFRAAMLAAARHWRNFYAGYAHGLRDGDPVLIAHAFDELAIAEELRSRLHGYFYPQTQPSDSF